MAKGTGTAPSKPATRLAVAAASMVGLLGCSDPKVGLGPLARCELSAGEDGWVEASNTPCGIKGSWYAYNDCGDSPDDCTRDQQPDGDEFANRQSWMCTCGTTTGRPDEEGDEKWGAGIGLDLNSSRGANPVKRTLGEAERDAEHLVGFSFELGGVAPGLRVNFRTASTVGKEHFEAVTEPASSTDESSADPHCWYSELEDSTAENEDPLVSLLEGESEPITVLFRDTAQGKWVSEADLVPLDWTAIEAIQFEIPATTVPVRFDFCIGRLAALY